jgi:hypothetical protein
VPLTSDAHYKGLVEVQLRHAGVAEPPVSVDDVAAILGVPTMTVAFPAWFTGAIGRSAQRLEHPGEPP